jgi:leucyl/phenylalanyl-tRNA---protein transferase
LSVTALAAVNVLGADPSIFPPVESADEDGILAIGGDLSQRRLVHAYRNGIFPWYSEGLPILWHCPDPRFVLLADELHVPRSLKKAIARKRFEIRFDTAFEAVIDACAKSLRKGQRGTWITRDMRRAYVGLHRSGLAHSAEAYVDGALVGGLYGVCLGQIFFGESMFAAVDDASKVAFVTLVQWMKSWGVSLIDCQQQTAHLERFGAVPWPRQRFVESVRHLSALPTRQERWSLQP